MNSPCLTKEPPALHVLMAEQSRPVQPDPAGVSHTSWYWETLPLIQPVTEHNGTKSPCLMCAQWLPRTDGAHSFVMPVSRRKNKCVNTEWGNPRVDGTDDIQVMIWICRTLSPCCHVGFIFLHWFEYFTSQPSRLIFAVHTATCDKWSFRVLHKQIRVWNEFNLVHKKKQN